MYKIVRIARWERPLHSFIIIKDKQYVTMIMHYNSWLIHFFSRVFNWFAYVLIFYNGLAGVLAAVLRGFLSVFIGLLLFIRLDRVILTKGFERFDKGTWWHVRCMMDVCTAVYIYTVGSRKRAHGRCTLHWAQTGGWAADIRVASLLHFNAKERPVFLGEAHHAD